MAVPRVPQTMRAVAIDRFGPPSALRVRRLPVPKPRPGEVLIRLEASGIGSWDASIRDGSWRAPGAPRFPLIPGTDGTGTVIARGMRVRSLQVGDRVYAYEFGNPRGGFYAEYTAVRAANVARVPAEIPRLQAAAIVPIALTALQGIEGKVSVRRGQTVLVFGASGGVGSLAVQLARHRGARVLATASGRRAERLVRRLGASAVLDGRRDDLSERLWRLAPDGLDAVIAFAGGDRLERCLDLLKPGRPLAFPNGVEPPPRRRRSMRSIAYDLAVDGAQLHRLEKAIVAAHVRVPVAAVFPLVKAAAAHRRLARGGIAGRMVLRIRP